MNELVPCSWISSGALEVWRLQIRSCAECCDLCYWWYIYEDQHSIWHVFHQNGSNGKGFNPV